LGGASTLEGDFQKTIMQNIRYYDRSFPVLEAYSPARGEASST